jgi:hypothetical protein
VLGGDDADFLVGTMRTLSGEPVSAAGHSNDIPVILRILAQGFPQHENVG